MNLRRTCILEEHVSWKNMYLGILEEHVSWKNMYLGRTCILEEHVSWKNMYLGRTCILEEHVSWKNMYLGRTCILEEHVSWKNMYLGRTCILEEHVSWKNMYLGRTCILEEFTSFPQEAEADMRIILHIYWALSNSFDSFVVLTSDTDVLVLLIRYTPYFLSIGLKSLYMLIGIGKSMRFLSFHKITVALGKRKCANILKARIATGCDWISKIGTKNRHSRICIC